MSTQAGTLENKYFDLRRLIEKELSSVTGWLDSYADSSDAHNCQLFQRNMDRQFKLRDDLERIDSRLAAYAQIEPFSEELIAAAS